MTGWILILTLLDMRGRVVSVEAVAAPFASERACRSAGTAIRATPPPLGRLDWAWVPTGPAERRGGGA